VNTRALFALRPRALAAAVLAGCGIVAAAVNYPGSLSYDSFTQLAEGRAESYANWHPPVMSWMLGMADAVVPGAGLFMLFDMALAFGALVSILWLRPKAGWATVAAAAVIVCLPQFFLYQSIIWKDVLFADAALTGFVSLAWAAVRWRVKRLRFALLAASALFLALAALARQNGAVIVPCAAAALGWIAFVESKSRRGAVAYAAGALLLVGAIVLAANAALRTRLDEDASGTAGQFKLLELYDLVGMTKADPALPLTVLDKSAPDLAAHIRGDGVRLFTPARNDTLAGDQPLQNALADTDDAVVEAQWQKTLRERPGAYLSLRARLFAWVFATPDLMQCHAYHVGAEGDPEDLKSLGMQPRFDARDKMLDGYAHAFAGTPVFSHLFYALLAIGALVLLLRRRAPADLAMAGLIAASFAFALTFFAISIACDYRYLYVLDLSALAAALYLAPSIRFVVRASARK
jgi:hypothetical protein